jgi:hypothetical protein
VNVSVEDNFHATNWRLVTVNLTGEVVITGSVAGDCCALLYVPVPEVMPCPSIHFLIVPVPYAGAPRVVVTIPYRATIGSGTLVARVTRTNFLFALQEEVDGYEGDDTFFASPQLLYCSASTPASTMLFAGVAVA